MNLEIIKNNTTILYSTTYNTNNDLINAISKNYDVIAINMPSDIRYIPT